MKLKPCENCGGEHFRDNNGVDHYTQHTGAHVGLHGLASGHPIAAAIGLTAVAMGFLIPKKLTCINCGLSVKA